MRDYCLTELKQLITDIVGKKNILVDEGDTYFYRKGIRIGAGSACAVVMPKDLIEFWQVIRVCVEFDKIIIIQAANTGLTGGSTPDGDDYDRDVVIINTLKLNQLILLNQGLQVLAFPGTTLYQLEDRLAPIGRGPHSVIGSSCIGASVIGGVCNNSGGNLVNRGPAYTELSLYARLNDEGNLELVNHLGIELGNHPEEILKNLISSNFNINQISDSLHLASDSQYKERVRDITSSIPARFNSDRRRLYEASGCAGKIAVFAVRLDTFPKPSKEQVFFVGSNDPTKFTTLRKKILSDFIRLPDMGEYLHRSYFDGSAKYCKDTFLLLKYFGTSSLPRLLYLKRSLDNMANSISIFPDNIGDKALQFISELLPNHIPKRIREYREKYDHYMLFVASDEGIEEMEQLLLQQSKNETDFEFIRCTKLEGDDVLLHRYVAGAAPARFGLLNPGDSGGLLPLDVALPRNCDSWHKLLPQSILDKMSESFQMGHFLCMVFHWDFVIKKGENIEELKKDIFRILKENGAKYPAEHNVGHIYKAENSLVEFYEKLDPTNSFNSGIGQTSKNKFYK